jgi:hypothetical protein
VTFFTNIDLSFILEVFGVVGNDVAWGMWLVFQDGIGTNFDYGLLMSEVFGERVDSTFSVTL